MTPLQVLVLSCVNFDCETFEMKAKHCNCRAKTKSNLASTKTRKWVIVILRLPLQRYLTMTTKKLNWSIAIVLQKMNFRMSLIMLNEGNQGDGTRKDLQKRCHHPKQKLDMPYKIRVCNRYSLGWIVLNKTCKERNYWVHSVCKGSADASEKDILSWS